MNIKCERILRHPALPHPDITPNKGCGCTGSSVNRRTEISGLQDQAIDRRFRLCRNDSGDPRASGLEQSRRRTEQEIPVPAAPPGRNTQIGILEEFAVQTDIERVQWMLLAEPCEIQENQACLVFGMRSSADPSQASASGLTMLSGSPDR